MPASNQAYTNQVLKVVVAQICQTIGFNSVQSTPMEVMIDVLHNYIRELCVLTKDFAEHYNRTEPNLEDVALAYREMKINFDELKEYMEYVDPIPFALPVPKYPIPKESHLNFLKPGSQEVLTRPMHIPEYLPPMQPEPEEEVPLVTEAKLTEDGVIKDEMLLSPTGASAGQQPVFRKPSDLPLPVNSSDSQRRFKFDGNEGLKETREISSVIMTTSGFISPAREGKLPDAKPPIIIPDKRPSPPPPPAVIAPLPVNNMDNKFEEKTTKKKSHDPEKEKKKKVKKELFQTQPLQQPPVANPVDSLPRQPPLFTSQLPASSIQQKTHPTHPLQKSPVPISEDIKPIVPIVTPPTVPRKPGRPRKLDASAPGQTVQKEKVKKPKNTDAKVIKQIKKLVAAGRLPPLPMEELINIVKAQNKKLPPTPGSTSSQIPGIFHQQPSQQQPNQFMTAPAITGHPTQPSNPMVHPIISGNKFDGKLSTESDKSKLNIFKKMPSSSKMVQHDFPSASSSMIKSEMFPKSTTEFSPSKTKFKPDFDISSTPLNMAMNKAIDFNRSPIEDLTMPMTPQYMPRTPEMKGISWNKGRDEQKKKKEKPEKKLKKIKTPPLVMPFPDVQHALNRMSLPGMSGFPQPNTSMQTPRFPFFPNLIPSGPGLIPNNAFFSGPFSTTQFGAPPFHNMSSLFPGDILQNLNKMRSQLENPSSSINEKFSESLPMEIKHPQCNVPPLLPPTPLETLQQPEKTKGRPESPPSLMKLPRDTVAIPLDPSGVSQYSSFPQPHQPSSSKKITVEKHDEITVKKEFVPAVHKDPVCTEIPSTSVNLETGSSLQDDKEDKESKKDKKLKKKNKKKDKTKEKDRDKDRSERKKDKEERKREKKEKRREKERLAMEQNKILSSNTDSIDNSDSSLASVPKLTLKLGVSGDSRPNTPDISKRMTIKSTFTKKRESDSDISSPLQFTAVSSHRESSPELAKISALVTHPPKQKMSHKRKHDEDILSGDDSKIYSKHIKSPSSSSEVKKHKKSTPQPTTSTNPMEQSASSSKIMKEEEGQQIWICPACGQVDNGTPMIGCDKCDNWYHWVCVGIQVPPDDNEDWYCRVCISRKQDAHGSEKKKKRKKNKEKAEKL